MGQTLTISLLENTDCCFTAVDSTAYPATNGKVNRAFIEFVLDDDELIFNKVTVAEDSSDIERTTTIPIEKDGDYNYYKLVIPTLDFYKSGTVYTVVTENVKRYFYYNGKIYRLKDNETEVTISLENLSTKCIKIDSIADLWDTKDKDTNIYSFEKEYFTICRFKKCFLSTIAELTQDYIDNGCSNSCGESTDADLLKRDFMIDTLFVLDWLLCNKEYDEVLDIIHKIFSCSNFFCPNLEAYTSMNGGCNCGKH